MDRPVKMEWGRAVGNAYAALRDNIVTYLIIVSAWGAVGYTVAQSMMVLAPAIFEVFPSLRSASREALIAIATAFIVIPIAVVAIAGAITLVVSFHRIIVLKQAIHSPFPVSARDILRYAWRVTLVFAPLIVAIMVMGFLAYALSPEDKAARAALTPYLIAPFLLVVLGAALALGRLCIVLPATAVGDASMTLTRAWRVTKGHSWRIFWGTAICALPFNVVGKMMEKAQANLNEDSAAYVAAMVTGFVVETMGYAVAAAFFSYTYLHVSGGEVPAKEASATE